MNMQIKSIVLYGHEGQKRILKFKPGKLNIITGKSKTGKSALIDIVDYCFGSNKCEVAEGPIRRKVAWFGLHLQLTEGQAFIARRCPKRLIQSSEDCYIEAAKAVKIPEFARLSQVTNKDGLQSQLAAWAEISDNLHVTPAGQTRADLSATIRHAIGLCFQPQDEISQKKVLFHGTADRFVALALKDTLPYFMGAVPSDYVRKREELRRLTDELKACERQKAELEALAGNGVSKASALLAQARDVGLTDIEVDNFKSTVAELRQIVSTPISDSTTDIPAEMEFSRLSTARNELREKYKNIRDEISVIRTFEAEEIAFSNEAKEQISRLSTINIFDGADPEHVCPLCVQPLDNVPGPTAAQIRTTYSALSTKMTGLIGGKRKIEMTISALETQLQDIRLKLNSNRAEMESVRVASDQLTTLQENASRHALIIGRIGMYLESLPDLPDNKELDAKIKTLKIQCDKLNEYLNDEKIKEKLESIASIIAQEMTKWAKELKLEHSKYPLRFDTKNLTVVADTTDGPVPMDKMGSGENWVGHHLIVHLALHEWFVKMNRPVPRFLFLDQPSQVYYPPDKDGSDSMKVISEEEQKAVSRMFKLIYKIAKRVAPNLQIIVTEHADIKDKWYQRSVIERWRREGEKLVPEDWSIESTKS